jgi:hypothetical protein
LPAALDSKIDELYQQPLIDFTAARNALAKTLSGDDAKRVRALAKPTLVPWAVNQVYWHARAAYDRLMKSGERLRKAQIAALEGRSADVRAASEAHRHAIAEGVAEAERLAVSAGSKPGADALARTFEALSLATERSESPGRLTEALQPAGFEALAGVTPQPGVARTQPGAARAIPPSLKLRRTAEASTAAGRTRDGGGAAAPATRRDAQAERARREAEAKEAAAIRERDAAVKQAEAALARAQAAEQQARTVWERAHDELLEARRKVAALKLEVRG